MGQNRIYLSKNNQAGTQVFLLKIKKTVLPLTNKYHRGEYVSKKFSLNSKLRVWIIPVLAPDIHKKDKYHKKIFLLSPLEMIQASFFCTGRKRTFRGKYISATGGSYRRFPSCTPDCEFIFVFKCEWNETICIRHQDNPHGTCEKKKKAFKGVVLPNKKNC